MLGSVWKNEIRRAQFGHSFGYLLHLQVHISSQHDRLKIDG